MRTVRIGVIGMGHIGRHHAGYLVRGEVARAELAAICSRQTRLPAELGGVPMFQEPRDLLNSGAVDAVLIATPHPAHPAAAIAAFEAGLHVLVEKPLAAQKADAERILAAHRLRPELVFSAMFQLRVEPRYQRIREMLQRGELGELTRVAWIATDWFRPEAYYTSSAWRATWRGEGGGVLLNQAMHQLDMLQWLAGMPRRVRAICHFGRHHEIEVEDDVTAVLEWDQGATGVFITSTGEVPGTNRLEVCGTRGRLVLENEVLNFTRNAGDSRDLSRTATQPFVRPVHETVSIPFANATAPHAAITQNFVNAILDGEPLIAAGADGVSSVELANAMVLSTLRGEAVELPMDSAAWEARLNDLIASSTAVKQVRPTGQGDVASSFNR